LAEKSDRVAWATDTLDEANGVAVTVRTAAARARRAGLQVTVVASGARPRADFDLESFAPIWQRPVPRYEELALRVPPFLETIEFLERERFREVLISTPGPVGLTALVAGKLLGLARTGIYHTDFPRYVAALGGGDKLVELTWTYLRWFYGQMDRVFVSSRADFEELVAHGLPPERLVLLPHDEDRGGASRRRWDDLLATLFGAPPGAERPAAREPEAIVTAS
jgi:hypothetical protein